METGIIAAICAIIPIGITVIIRPIIAHRGKAAIVIVLAASPIPETAIRITIHVILIFPASIAHCHQNTSLAIHNHTSSRAATVIATGAVPLMLRRLLLGAQQVRPSSLNVPPVGVVDTRAA